MLWCRRSEARKGLYTSDSGISMPLIFLALFALSFMSIMLVTVSRLSLKDGQFGLQRSEVTAAADAGLHDFLYRLETDNVIADWTANKALNPRHALSLGHHISETDFPTHVRESGFSQWVPVPGSDTEYFTYDIIKKYDDKLILRVTGRSEYDIDRYKTFDFEINIGNTLIDNALYFESPFISPDQAELIYSNHGFRAPTRNHGRHHIFDHNWGWGEAANRDGKGKMPWNEYKARCLDKYPSADKYDFSAIEPVCIRANFSGADEYVGDITTPYPLVFHGPASCLASFQCFRHPGKLDDKITALTPFPIPTGKIHVVSDESKNELRNKLGVSTLRDDICLENDQHRTCHGQLSSGKNIMYKASDFIYDRTGRYDDDKWDVIKKDSKGKKSSMPVSAEELIKKADCTFYGNTQIIVEDDHFYVLSPSTPNNANKKPGIEPWCSEPAGNLYGKIRDPYQEDIPLFGRANALRTKDLTFNSGVQSYVPVFTPPKGKSVVIAVKGLGTKSCGGGGATLKFDSTWNETRIGYPARYNSLGETVANRDRSDLVGTDDLGDTYDCHDGDLFIDGRISGKITFVAEDDIYLTGGVRYSSRYDKHFGNALPKDSEDLAGFVAKKNIMVRGAGLFYDNRPSEHFARRNPRMGIAQFNKVDLYGHQMGTGTGKEYLKMPSRLINPIASANTPNDKYWLPLPLYDGVYIAEQGFFGLQMPFSMHALNNPVMDRRMNVGRMDLVVFGAVYQKYKGYNHREVRDGSEWRYYGLNEKFYYDERLKRMSPPGFVGTGSGGDNSLPRKAEVYEAHLAGCFEVDGSPSKIPDNLKGTNPCP